MDLYEKYQQYTYITMVEIIQVAIAEFRLDISHRKIIIEMNNYT